MILNPIKQYKYNKNYKIIKNSGLFDEQYYLFTYSDVRKSDIDPIKHYILIGADEGRNPNKEFDTNEYLENNKDLRESKLNPLVHYILCGKEENRKVKKEIPTPLIDSKIYNNKLKKIKYSSTLEAFDVDFYLNNNGDVKKAEIDPYEHYKNNGWKEGRMPNSWFDPLYYLEKYEDVKTSSMEPLDHYVKIGQEKNRKTQEFKICKISDQVKANIPKVVFDDTEDIFIEYQEHNESNFPVKVIAFYLPQFHPFKENDEWWGKGFTEWTNVTNAKENFEGHYQPHLPIHNGFYDLRIPEVMIEQAKLARNYGISGFNFYYYWFDGKVLMHKPFEILLKYKEIDIDFCITWANENWTRRWDGAENDILIGQNHCDEDSIKFIQHMFQYFNDDRYIKIDNKPVLIIYRADIIPRMSETIQLWREEVEKAGYDGIYLICSQTFGIKSPKTYGFDAAMEFPPHTVKSNIINKELNLTNDEYDGNIYDYDQVVDNACLQKEPEYKLFKTKMLSWDNTARKQNSSHIFANFSLLKYKQWLSESVFSTLNNPKYKMEEKIIFINAWNEWAEGTHLEPDRKFGYGYLQATYDVLKNTDINNNILFKKFKQQNEVAVVLHIHFTDIWEDIHSYLKNLDSFGFDLYITLTNINNDIINKILKYYPEANIRMVDNRGRDILPFIDIYRDIKNFKYKAVCKIHSKKSQYRNDGKEIRNELYEGLLGNYNIINNILEIFKFEQKVGLITNSKYLINHTEHNMRYDKDIVDNLSELMTINFQYDIFPAGSMFWFNPKALNGIEKIQNNYFLPEEGLADGTVSHAVERLICNIVKSNGFSVQGIK